MTLDEVTKLIVAILVVLGGGIAYLLNWAANRRKENLEDINKKFSNMEKKQQECEEERKISAIAYEKKIKELNDRIVYLELFQQSELPSWTRTQDGVLVFANKEFIRVFCSPYGYRVSDILGKKFEDLPLFPFSLVQLLRDMDVEAVKNKYSSRSNVPITKDMKATIVKSFANAQNGDVLFIAYAVPIIE